MVSLNSILVTGGTGSFGKEFIKKILSVNPNIERLVIFSRDELKQWELQNQFPMEKYPGIRYFIGDIRDKNRLKRALEGIDIVVHAAALKQVPIAEYNPMEFINTNVIGANNLIESCLDTNVKRVVALSTDKASAPINLYGATKLCSDKLFIAANNIKGKRNLRFSVVRYGNVMGSRGSVIPFFLNKSKSGNLPITDIEMTRFNIVLKEGVELVINAIQKGLGGEIFIPKIPSYRITDVADAICPNCKKIIIGKRPGEKLHEEMISPSESTSTIDIGNSYVIVDGNQENKETFREYINEYGEKSLVPKGFSYDSSNNSKFLTVEEIRDLIKINIDKNFNPC